MISELEKRGYYIGDEIGEGSFGKVYSASNVGATKKYAVKIIDNVNTYLIDDI